MAFTPKEKALRKEYSTVSRRLRQQLKRLTAAYPENNLKDWLAGEFPTLKEVGRISNKGMSLLLKRAKGIYQSGLLTIPKYEASLVQSAKTLNEAGFGFVTPDNAEAMWRFIDDMRARGLADIYGYRYFVDQYSRITNDGKLTPEQLEATVQDWTEYAERYQKRVNEARRKGKPAPRPKDLKFTRKIKNDTGSQYY